MTTPTSPAPQVGQVYDDVYRVGNPFEPTVEAKVLAVKDGWIKYVIGENGIYIGDENKNFNSCKVDNFLSRYTLRSPAP